MNYEPIRFEEKLGKIAKQWTPKIVVTLNDYEFKLAKIQGDFVWHSHEDTDEAFIVLKGEMRIDFRDGSVTLGAGEMFVVPKGVEHKPCAERECSLLLVEPGGVVNTGDAGGEMTAPTGDWV